MDRINRYLKEPAGSFFLFGPRGTGKSTWLTERYKKELYIDLLESENYRSYSAHPERLRSVLDGNPDKKTIIIDEIQKVPALLDMVHKIIEDEKNKKFILTGSSARKLKKYGVDLLAGRAVLKTMHPFMASELGKEFDFVKSMKLGFLPVVYGAPKPEETLKAYIDLYIREEIQTEGIVRNIGPFSRFLEASSFSHASVLNTSNIARECEVERKTVENYIGILEDLLLAFKLPVFSKKAKRVLAKHNKFYIFDAGIFRTIRPSGPLDRAGEIEGACLEGIVAQHLRAWIAYSNSNTKLFFWRTLAGSEIDFVIYGSDVFCAIEVKNSSKIHPQDMRALKTFAEDYPESTQYLLYRGKEKLKINNVLCLPIAGFLSGLIPGNRITV